jgi:enoyl-CoA hydratase/carnithine racemase
MPTITYEVDDKVARVTLDRPEKLNAINAEMRVELYDALRDVQANHDVWVAVIAGQGGAFSVGHDLTEDFAAESPDVPSIEDLYLLMRGTYKPIVAVIDGYCLAQGAGIALCSDIRVASTRAQLGWPQVKRGIASISGPALLAHQVPLNIAMETLLLGDAIDAERALALHLVNRVVAVDKLTAAAHEIVMKLRRNAPLAMRSIKEAAVRGLPLSTSDRIHLCGLMLKTVNATADAREGLGAFVEKRQPVWSGQ